MRVKESVTINLSATFAKDDGKVFYKALKQLIHDFNPKNLDDSSIAFEKKEQGEKE